MKTGFVPIAVVVAIAVISLLGGGYAIAQNFLPAKSRKIEPLKTPTGSPRPLKESPATGEFVSPVGQLASPSPIVTPTATPASSPTPSPVMVSGDGPTTYKQPQGKYTIVLPVSWVYNSTTATTTYSTTKFTGPSGYVAITFGSGKDPIGGCSETSAVILADRTINGCYLLQKDGSQLLTRTYTKDKAGIDFTIEAYINPQLSVSKPVILDVIKSIDIE